MRKQSWQAEFFVRDAKGNDIEHCALGRFYATRQEALGIAWTGADHVVEHSQPLRPQIESLGLKFVDYIANFNDTDRYWDAMGDLVAPQGAVCMIVGGKGPLAQDAVRAKSATVCWELMFTRPRFQTPDMIEQHRLLTRVAELIEAGKIRRTLRERLAPINAANLRAAHAKLESGATIGKLVVAGWA